MQTPRQRLQAAIESGMTQSEIAAETGVPQATISRILSGEHSDPRYSTAQKVMALKVKKPRRKAPAPVTPAEQVAA
ncbi:hypothetical protein LMG18090_04739 [Ralstonia mannitolilytica]|uniref:helix-turn-helix domain-containing protein n=1 Tax=Ralstonia mannitolilytica TaxID=105219 RepID=UPI0028F5FAD6|nr:helix-turn-helix domain-containing protein [Ralstonia mannitolilytica]CAJ0805131.1 hypothetical protein LMG18090_04739 [Ralstonia mannitolilytica]